MWRSKDEWRPATVPGGTYTDLMASGTIPDPFLGENEKQAQWVADHDWEYRREFQVEQNLLDGDRVELVCMGLDTLADVTLNGQLLGKTDNMFRQRRVRRYTPVAGLAWAETLHLLSSPVYADRQ